MTITTFKNLQQAYEEKKLKYHDPGKYIRMQKYKERKAKGLCVICGHKKITVYQHKVGLVTCYKCRKRKKEEKCNQNTT